MPPVREIFQTEYDQDILRAAAAIVILCHLTELEYATDQYGEVGADRKGLLRWIRTDSEILRLINAAFDDQPACFVPNGTNGGRHVEILAGRFRLILAHDIDPENDDLPSEYARTLAAGNQLPLFSMNDEVGLRIAQCDEEYPYTAILFRSKDPNDGIPLCVEVRFPASDGSYACEPIDLYMLFPELSSAESVHEIVAQLGAPSVEPEEIPDESHPTPREDEEESDGQAESA